MLHVLIWHSSSLDFVDGEKLLRVTGWDSRVLSRLEKPKEGGQFKNLVLYSGILKASVLSLTLRVETLPDKEIWEVESRGLDDLWENEVSDQVYLGENKMHDDLVENSVMYYLSPFKPCVFFLCVISKYISMVVHVHNL